MSGILADAADQQVSGGQVSPFPGWEPFVPRLVHPLKVAIVEALLCIEEPLSAVQLGKIFGGVGAGFRESNIRYHLNHLVEVGVLEINPVRHRQDGYPRRKLFYFAPMPMEHG